MPDLATSSIPVVVSYSGGSGVVLRFVGSAEAKPRRVKKREDLMVELHKRLGELGSTKDWCPAVAGRTYASALVDMYELGNRIIDAAGDHWPQRLNISAAETGEITFALFGAGGRRAELWVGAAPGVMQYVAVHNAVYRDGELPIANYSQIAGWLRGEDSLPG